MQGSSITKSQPRPPAPWRPPAGLQRPIFMPGPGRAATAGGRRLHHPSQPGPSPRAPQRGPQPSCPATGYLCRHVHTDLRVASHVVHVKAQ
jgi:hypothetical protein